MKFPKMKHTVLCQILLYLPALLPLVSICLLGPVLPQTYEWIWVVVCIALSIVTLVYLAKNFPLLMLTDAIFSVIRAWKKDRLWYESDCNGSDRQTAERIIMRRLRHRGREVRDTFGTPRPLCMRHEHRYSWTISWKTFERFYTLYSVEYLDADGYRAIMRAAAANAKFPPCRKIIDRQKRKAPVAVAGVVIILADRIAEDIPALLRKEHTYENSCHLACVADFSVGRYYFDGMAEPYMPGIGKPVKNQALACLRRAVFGGRLPLHGNPNLAQLPKKGVIEEFPPEMSLWEFIRKIRREISEGSRQERAIFKKLKNGEVLFREEILYCKLNERAVSFLTETEEENPSPANPVTVLMEWYWEYPRRAVISKKDMAELSRRIQAYFAAEGHQVRFEMSEK